MKDTELEKTTRAIGTTHCCCRYHVMKPFLKLVYLLKAVISPSASRQHKRTRLSWSPFITQVSTVIPVTSFCTSSALWASASWTGAECPTHLATAHSATSWLMGLQLSTSQPQHPFPLLLVAHSHAASLCTGKA